MSKEIESKVVSMEFDNSQFEKPAKESMSTIDKLKEALNFKGVENGMNSINKAIKAVTFDPMIKGVDTVYAKFTAFERFTIQLYDRLANSIINTTTRIGREIFTIPVSSGKSEYEQKMGSIQTIMASTGESLETVNGYLDELNKYSDDTIYSFSDMTNNIGKFTNAGVKLKDSVAAIKGISNEAALSGANAAEASRAMYNFAQALSTGAVKLIDWKSIENANMATVSFKEELIDTAVALGTLTKAENGLYKTTKGKTLNAVRNFNDSLQDAWLTSDVLITTLKKYSDSSVAGSIGDRAQKAATEVKTLSMMLDTLKEALQSGWAESWQWIIGDFEQAKEMWTNVSNVLGGLIGRLSEARNSMLKYWATYGGRASMILAFSNIWKTLTSVLGTVKKAFNEVIPPLTGKRLIQITRMFENFTDRIKPSNETLLKLQRTFRGFFSVIGIGIDAAKALFNALAPLFGDVFKWGTTNILSATSSLGDWLYNLRQTIKEGRVFETFFGKLASVLAFFGRGFKRAFSFIVDVIKAFNADGFKAGLTAIKDGFVNLLKDIWAKLKEFDPIGSIKKLGVKMAEAIYEWPVGRAVIDFVKNVRNAIVNSPVWKFCVSVVEGFIDTIQNVINKFRGIDTSATEEFTDNVKKGFGPLEAIKRFFTAIWHGILAVWEVIGPAIKTIGSAIGTMFKNMWNSITSVINKSDMGDVGLFNAGTGLGAMMLTISAFIRDLTKTVKNANETSKGIKKLFGSLLDVLRAFKVDLYSKAIKDVAISIGILAASLFVLSALPAPAIARATGTILLLFRSLTASVQAFSSVSSNGIAGAMASVGAQILAIGVAVGVMVASMVILTFLPYEGLLKGVAVLVLLMRAITAETKSLSEMTGSAKVAGIILAMGVFLQMLLVPLSVLSLIGYFNPAGLLAAAVAIGMVVTITSSIIIKLQESTSEYGEKMPKIAGTFVAMMLALSTVIISIAALAGVVALLSKLGHKEAFVKAATYIGVVVATLGMIAIVLSAMPMLIAKFQPIAEITKYDGTGTMTLHKKFDTSNAGTYAKQRGGFGVIIGALLGMAVAIAAVTAALVLVGFAAKYGADVHEAFTYMSLMVAVIGIFTILCVAFSKASTKMEAKATLAVKDIKTSISILPPLASYAIAFSVAILAVAAAAKILEKVSLSSIGKAGLVLAGITVFIGGLAALSAISKGADKDKGIKSFGDRFSSGLMKVAKAVKEFSKIALIFAGAVAIIVGSIAIIMKSTDSDITAFVKMIEDHKDEIIKAVQQIAEIALTAALSGLFTALKTLTSETILGLNEMLDTLIDQAPELLAKIFILIGKVLDGIAENAFWITEKLVIALLAVMDGIATAIDKHKDKIISAFDKLVQGITDLWVKGLGGAMGLSEDFLDWFSGGIGKATTATVIGISAISKAITGTVATFSAIKKVGSGAIGVVKTLIEGFKAYSHVSAAATVAGVSFNTMLNTAGFTPAVANIAKVVNVIGGKLLPALASPIGVFGAVAIAGGIAIKKIVDSHTKAMQVVTKNDEYVAASIVPITEETNRLNDALSERTKAFASIDEEGIYHDRVLEKLRSCVDENGKLKAGYEWQFNYIKNALNGVLDIELDMETQKVQVIDEQNQKIDIQSQKIEQLMKRKQLQAKIEKAEEAVMETRDKISSHYYENQIAAAAKAREDWLDTIYIGEDGAFSLDDGVPVTQRRMLELRDEYNRLSQQVKAYGLTSLTDDKDRALYAQLLNPKAHRYFDDVTAKYEDFDGAIARAKANMASAIATVQNVDNAYKALDGTIEEMDQATANLSFNLLTKEAGALPQQLVSQFTEYTNQFRDLLAADLVTPEIRENYEQIFTTLTEAMGDTPEGQKELENLGYKDADTWMAGIEKRIKEPDLVANDMLGISKAFITGKKSMGQVIKDLVDYSVGTYQKETDQNSPSKVYEKLGTYDILGLINGVTKKEGTLQKAYSAMATANMAAYTAAMSKQTSGFAWSPLVNTSGFQNGINSMQSQFAGLQNGVLNTGLTTRLATSIDMTRIEASNREMSKTMTDMQRDFNTLSLAVQNMQIVLDDGILVGRMAPAMDSELGRRASRKRRGV